jgi:uncharacterized protein YgiM (DUF1202 family)
MKPLENTSITHQGSKTSGIARSLKKLGLLLPSSAWVGLAGFLLAAAILVLHVPSAAAQSVRVNSGVSALNVRNGPGTQYGYNGRPLYAGEVVRVVASSGGWYQLPDGGWFSAAYTTSVGTPPSGGPGPGPSGTPVNFSVRATTTVNVRNGPGTQYAFNGRPLYPGETVRVVRSTGNWYQLPDGGWFSAAYTTGTGGTGGPGTGTGTGTPVNFRARATTWVNVRNGPGIGYSLNGRPLNQGEVVRVVRSTGSWYQLPDGGWFSASYATPL